MRKYYSRKEKRVGFIYLLIALAVWVIPLLPALLQKDSDPLMLQVMLLIAVGISFLLYDIWMYTRYEIRNGYLHWNAGHLFHGRVPLSAISKLTTEKNVLTVNGIYKPTLCYSGNLTVVYNSYDELLIAPEDEEAFIRELLLGNPKIRVALNRNSSLTR